MKSEYWINVTHVDNRLVVYLNGETVWDSGIVHGDPAINEFINITEQLTAHPEHISELIFEGFNDSFNLDDDGLNPWHFSYRLFRRTVNEKGEITGEQNLLIPYDEKHLSNPNIRAINNAYQIMFKNGEFKVVSNSLSQQFFQ